MIICSQCKYSNPPIAKFCNNCGSELPTVVETKKLPRTVKQEKLIVIISLTVVSVLLLGMTGLFYIEKTSGFKFEKRQVSTASTEEDIERRKEALRNFNDGNFYDTAGNPVAFYLKGRNLDTLIMSSPTLNYQFYLDFTRRSDVKSKFRQEDFKTVVFDNGEQQWRYDLWNDN